MASGSSAGPLEHAIAEYIARRESGDGIAPEAFVEGYPELGPALLESLRTLEETEALFPEADLPASVGPYRILGEIGRGAMGRVLRVEHEDRPGEPYALKLLGLAAQVQPRLRKRFAREAEYLERVQHPGIVRIHDVGPPGGEPFLVMDIVEGTALSELVASGRARRGSSHGTGASTPVELVPLPVPRSSGDDEPGESAHAAAVRAAALVEELARALDALHNAGILHRDVKPSNVIVRPDGQPVLVDFGLSTGEDSSTLTHTGDVLGTPHYMAPEQARGEPTDERTDVYALGAVLHELLTLHPPHAGPERMLVLESIRRGPPAPIRRVEPSVPGPLAAIVERALAFRASQRYASAAALAEDLAAFRTGRPVSAGSMRLERTLLGLRRVRYPVALGVLGALALTAAVLGGLAVRERTPVVDRDAALRAAIDRAAVALGRDDSVATGDAAREILELDPGNVTGEFLLVLAEGSVLVDSEDPAIEALIYGIQRMNEGRFREARADFRRAAELDPSSPLPVALAAQIARAESELEVKERELVRALEEEPESAAYARELGRIYYQLDKPEKAIEALELAILNDPGYSRTYETLARSRMKAGDLEGGLETALLAARLFGRQGDAILTDYCELLMPEGEYELARAALLSIIDRNADDADLHCRVARTYDFAERILEAKEWYERALAIDPEHIESMKAMLHIRTGANRLTCADCEAAFESNPDLYDPDEAVDFALRLLDRTEGRDLGLTRWIVEELCELGLPDVAEGKLLELIDRTDSDAARENLRGALDKARG